MNFRKVQYSFDRLEQSADRSLVMDAIVLRTGFEAVTHTIQFESQKVVKGKALALSHVNRVEEFSGFGSSRVITASVIRTTSVTEHPYKVKLEVSHIYMC